MIPFNRYLTAALVILSIAPIAQAAVLASPVAVIAGKVGYAVVPFCAGVVRGVATYKEDRKTQLSRLVKDDILVGATTTGALMMQNVPQWDQQNSLIHNAGVTYSGSNKYYVSVNGKFQIGCDFDTEQTAQAHLDRMQGEAKSTAAHVQHHAMHAAP